jgi:hypothetical protein
MKSRELEKITFHKNVPDPVIKSNEVLVRMMACEESLNKIILVSNMTND